MKTFAFCKNGLVQWTTFAPADLSLPPSPGFDIIEIEQPLGPQPFDGASYDINAGQWVDARPLSEHKAVRWSAIKRERSQREYAGFAWDGSTFDSDAISQSRIQGAVQLANIGPAAFSIDWTLADNTVRTLSGADMVAVGLALAQHINGLHVISRGLRAQIDAATSVAEVESVVWPTPPA